MAASASAPRPGVVIALVAAVIAVRVLGISALMPVFEPYGRTLTDNGLLVGLAFGGYGLTLALMQIPTGALSDRLGRRPVLAVGLLAYSAGNLLAFSADSIGVLIAGRLLEGLGGGSSVALALAADSVPESKRTFSLAIAGIGAGLAFLLGVALGPFAEAWIGVPGIFLASALLGGLLTLAVLVVVPGGLPRPGPDPASGGRLAAGLWRDPPTFAADFAGFAMNLTLTATMFALPLALMGPDGAGGVFSASGYRRFLLVSVLVGGFLSIGLSRAVDKRGAVRGMAIASAVAIGVGAAGVLGMSGVGGLFAAGILYFGAHGAQSAALPSLVGARFAPERRGAAMGIYSSSTFLGSFAGGLVGAALLERQLWLALALMVLGLATAAALVWAGSQRRSAPSTHEARSPS